MSNCQIHPTAVVHPTARLGNAVHIGPFAVVHQGVTIGDSCRVESHAVVTGRTRLGSHNYVGHAAVLGAPPQHRQAPLRYGGLEIGDRNTFRENCTVHAALEPHAETRIGHDCMLMVAVHVAHDCRLDDGVTLANNVVLAGHVTIGRRAFLSGAVAVHQFCRIGCLAMVGGQAHIIQDVPPCVTVDGASSCVVGLNVIGLRRAGVDSPTLLRLKQAYRIIYRTGDNRQEALARLARWLPGGPSTLEREFYEFLCSSRRGFLRDRHWSRRGLLRLVPPDGEGGAAAEVAEGDGPASRSHTGLRLRRAS